MIDFDDPIDAKWAQRVLDLETELDKTREIASEQFSYFEAKLSEAQAQKCEEIHPGFAEFRALQKDHRETVAQLAEARAEADRRVVALVDERRAYKAHIAEVESERDEARAEVERLRQQNHDAASERDKRYAKDMKDLERCRWLLAEAKKMHEADMARQGKPLWSEISGFGQAAAALLIERAEKAEAALEQARKEGYAQGGSDCAALTKPTLDEWDAACVKEFERGKEEGKREQREADAQLAEGGSFLHNDSPEARFGRSMAAAIRRSK